LETARHRYQGRWYWVVKEPVGLNYFRFEEEEYFLLRALDGGTSLDDLKARFEAAFPPQKIALDELQRFLGSLHRSGLVVADAAGQGEQLKRRRDERKRKERTSQLANILSLRFKGFDPENLLNALYPWTRWFFSLPAMVCCLLLALSALALIVVQFDTFQAKLPTFQQFFAAENWIWLAVALAATKILHEFGHALSCKHFGGECHEMGVMLLVLTPCLYCNVSDSWTLPSKWRRAAIGAAGMYVEVVIASLCVFLWWFSNPGILNYLCLSTIFVCSVGTVLFNGNPLLRYDGYYILSDLLEIPNLRQKASSILSRKLGAWCLGLKEPADPFLPRRKREWFAAYAVAAAVYRWVVTLAILWFLHKMFEPYRLEIVGQLLAGGMIYASVGRPLWRVFQFFRVPGRIHQVNRKRMYATGGLLAAALAFALFAPLPAATYCGFELQPRDAAPVYVDVPGVLEEIAVQPGQTVQAGQTLGRLKNIDARLAVAQLAGRRDQAQARLASLEQQRFRNAEAALEIGQARETLQAVEEQLRKKQRDLERLSLVAPVTGTVLPPPSVPPRDADEVELATWSGTPLATRNLGATLGESTLFCRIGDPRAFEAVLVIDQADIETVAVGQTVELQFDQMAGEIITGRVAEVARTELELSSARLSHKTGGAVATQTDAAGRERPMRTSYQALVPLDAPAGLLRQGLRGRAKIHVAPQTLAARAWKYLCGTFNFEL
jgi:putative peptide zinc metalloprotease protein